MLTRLLALTMGPCLPMAALIFPMSPAHRASALVAGTIATVLSGFALSSDRARVAAAVVAGWVALTAFIFPSTLLEESIALSWGMLMVAWLVGPFSAPPRVVRVPAARLAAPLAEETRGTDMPLAA